MFSFSNLNFNLKNWRKYLNKDTFEVGLIVFVILGVFYYVFSGVHHP